MYLPSCYARMLRCNIYLFIYLDVILYMFSHSVFQIVNGYFVHYFAPHEMPVFPKNVIFLIDRSGSMAGRKIEQVTYLRVLTSACISHTPQPFEEVTVNFTFETHVGFVHRKIFRHIEVLENTYAQI